MKRIKFLLPIVSLVFVLLFSCSDDDDGVVVVPPRERDEEAVASTLMVEKYLQTHFYNYEEFENPALDFDYNIVFDTIAGDNASKTPLIEQVLSKNVNDVNEDDVTYNLYYLKVRQGEGDEIAFTDIASITYEGTSLNEKEINDVEDIDGDGDSEEGIYVYPTNIFDSSVIPVRFDLTQIVKGMQAALSEFNGATGFTENLDGTLTFEEYGIGAVFIPSGLGYYNEPPPGIDLYSQLIFTFHTYLIEKGDQDSDGILSVFEDLNGDGIELNDDTDGNGVPNFADQDDDGDGRLTKNEVVANEYIKNSGDPDPELGENEVEMYREITNDETEEITIYTIVFTDENNDGIPDYLDDQL